MTDLLLRLFVKNYRDSSDPKVRTAMGTLSGYVGIVCNVLLCLGKLLVGTVTGSVSITADALNNLSDASGSIVTLVGFRMAGKPADEEHPYGHARAEYLSGLAVAVMILFIGFELAKTSLSKILSPAPTAFSWTAGLVLAASIAVKLWMFLFNRKLGRAIGSTALLATAADSRNDCAATGAVLLAAVLEQLISLPLDGWMGLAVAVFIGCSGFNLAKDTVSPLLGQTADPELKRRIVDYIENQPKVLGYHDLMVHDYGPGKRFASIHVEMDYREDPLECHERIDDMERECMASHGIHLVIHYDPVITDDPELTELKQKVAAILLARDSRLGMHDFRMVRCTRHRNLFFDLTLPSDMEKCRQELTETVTRELNRDSNLEYVLFITFDSAAFND